NAGAAIDPSGNYRIDGAPTGTVRVSATTGRGFAEGKSSQAQTVDLAPGGSQQVDITFKNDTIIRARLTRNSVSLAGASVSFTPRSAKATTTYHTTTDDQGRYTATGLDDAPYTVTVFDLQRTASFSTTYEVAGSNTFDIDMKSVTVHGH